uniref:Uncharacterized protein MANES_01G239500 n=1 Tax=Rhizophora mucronata TaxID=61149 RepID=A0A2P2M1Y9_RHIMU
MVEVVVSSEERMEAELAMEEDKEKKDDSTEVVRWEKLFPRMVLQVLLVEADDSTRQIISALLRKCGYRVAAAPDGLTAWEILKCRPHDIDFILTEVELPSISGYALLTLVMEHDVCKNIPVIMMSSHDSIGMVLKCMLKGAADFLIKPVRRNELRNLWQHVWRRQTVAAGHIPPNSPLVRRKIEATSENNAASDHSSDCATSTQKSKECSEREIDDQGHSLLKYRSASNVRNTERDRYERQVKLDKKSVDSECKTDERSSKLAPYNEACNSASLKLGEEHSCVETVTRPERLRTENDVRNTHIAHCNKNELVKPSSSATDLISTFDNNSPKCTYGHSSLNVDAHKFESTPQLELSLEWFHPSSLKEKGVNEKHLLNHSNASAFSRYNSKTLQPFFPMSADNNLGLKEDASISPAMSSGNLSQNSSGVYQPEGAPLSGNQEIMTTLVIGQSGQGEIMYPSPQLGLIPVPVAGARLENIPTGYGHVFPSIYSTQSGLPAAWNPKLAGEREHSPFPTNTSIHSNQEIQDSENNHRQSVETINNTDDQNGLHQNNMEPAKEFKHGSPGASQSASSSLCNGIENHNSSSTPGSLCSRNDGNATFAGAAERTIALESSNDGFKGMDSHRLSQREAALTKFRLKRKDRCYEKKVRYQSRKRLAEQRPRVKGQFVRQVQLDALVANANS